ncbi:SWIM zinc finger family protein [Microbacterium sp. EST19A]|uniref:SWIM zinc finger family protein n=1 Tax=Microbacterium sp. EST19A TaxID=2862681 RepID=UPI001CBDA79E|nr:SWIM zinc finger family protein [Microbacterium sp. EST19A]
MQQWTDDRIADAAPDDRSLVAGRKLGIPGPWTETGVSDTLLWGKCQGSGKTPYQVSIDLTAPAYRCTCPSRKFPCKHALGLLLLWSAGGIGSGGETADFAHEWAQKRAERQAPAAAPEAEISEAQKQQAQQRIAARTTKMDNGVADFCLWLSDVARAGLAETRRRDRSWWDGAAARLVDAQLPGLAERVRDIGGDLHRGLSDEELLHRVGSWWMLARAWQRRQELAAPEVAELRIALGWPVPTADVRQGEAIEGDWLICGAHRAPFGRLMQQRTWIRNVESGELSFTLETAGPGESLGVPQLAGSRMRAELALYPGTAPRRVLFPDAVEWGDPGASFGEGSTIAQMVATASARMASAPWRDRHPAVLTAVRLMPGTPPGIVDAEGTAVPVTDDTDTRRMLALTGGRPADVFGEWEGGRMRLLSLVVAEEVVSL